MYRLLLPGVGLKRWVLVHLLGMLVFSLGVWLILLPHWAYSIRKLLWTYWQRDLHHLLPDHLVVLFGVILLCCGLLIAWLGTKKLIAAFTRAANPHVTTHEMIEAILDNRNQEAQIRIVGIGGGTGLSTLLRGLKAYAVDLTAIVTVSDDGGSSGRLRMDLDMPPPGDIRNCLVALAEVEPLMERLFQHRFLSKNHGLNDHSLGNLIIAGLSDLTGDFLQAIQMVSRVLAVRGRVIPSANQALVLKATMLDGSIIRGETAIVARRGTITHLAIEPDDVPPIPEALEAIQQADILIVGPGSVYSSLLPNLLIPGMSEAFRAAPALKIFICNVMTQPGESDHFTASQHLEAMLRHLPYANPFHYVVVNTRRPDREILATYEKEDQFFVEPDLTRLVQLGSTPITGSLLAEAQLARHDPDKLARCILEKIADDILLPTILRRRAAK